ncbi:MAG: hypothetical protein WBQ73_00400 [Candidatus Babeliales bacterium]
MKNQKYRIVFACSLLLGFGVFYTSAKPRRTSDPVKAIESYTGFVFAQLSKRIDQLESKCTKLAIGGVVALGLYALASKAWSKWCKREEAFGKIRSLREHVFMLQEHLNVIFAKAIESLNVKQCEIMASTIHYNVSDGSVSMRLSYKGEDINSEHKYCTLVVTPEKLHQFYADNGQDTEICKATYLFLSELGYIIKELKVIYNDPYTCSLIRSLVGLKGCIWGISCSAGNHPGITIYMNRDDIESHGEMLCDSLKVLHGFFSAAFYGNMTDHS